MLTLQSSKFRIVCLLIFMVNQDSQVDVIYSCKIGDDECYSNLKCQSYEFLMLLLGFDKYVLTSKRLSYPPGDQVSKWLTMGSEPTKK